MIHLALYIINLLISLYALIMLIYCLCTWFIRDPANPVLRALGAIADPLLRPIRRLLYRFEFFRNSPVDFSPLILFLFLRLVVSAIGQISVYF